jgi:hypothetical protein
MPGNRLGELRLFQSHGQSRMLGQIVQVDAQEGKKLPSSDVGYAYAVCDEID